MALGTTKTLSFLLLAIFLLSHHSQARDSQFFSKFTNTNNNNNNVKETTTTAVVNPNNVNKEEDEPAFVPETQKDGYGLYGHESGQFPPSDTRNEEQHYTNTNTNTHTTYEPYTTPVGHTYKPAETQGANLYANNNNNNNNYESNNFGENKYVAERQGMSDTRFLENGRYYHDVSNEKMTYNPNSYDERSYDPNTYRSNNNNNNNNNNYEYNNKVIDYSNPKNWYNNRGNNNYNNYYGNNVNENTNSYETNKYKYNNNKNDNYYNNNNYNNNIHSLIFFEPCIKVFFGDRVNDLLERHLCLQVHDVPELRNSVRVDVAFGVHLQKKILVEYPAIDHRACSVAEHVDLLVANVNESSRHLILLINFCG